MDFKDLEFQFETFNLKCCVKIDDDEVADKVTDIWNRLAELIQQVEIIDQFDKQHTRQMKEAVDKVGSIWQSLSLSLTNISFSEDTKFTRRC